MGDGRNAWVRLRMSGHSEKRCPAKRPAGTFSPRRQKTLLTSNCHDRRGLSPQGVTGRLSWWFRQRRDAGLLWKRGGVGVPGMVVGSLTLLI